MYIIYELYYFCGVIFWHSTLLLSECESSKSLETFLLLSSVSSFVLELKLFIVVSLICVLYNFK